MNKLLGQYDINNVFPTGVPTLKKIYVYDDRVELEYWTSNSYKLEDKNHYNILVKNKKCIKKYAYEDLLLMNETINKIIGRPQNEKKV